MRRRSKVLAVGAGLITAALASWAFVIEPSRQVVREVSLALPGWPQALDGFRVALVSDLHVGSPFVDEARLVALGEALSRHDPDVLLIAGDLLAGHEQGAAPVDPSVAARGLGAWQARLGRFAVLGNHDWWVDGPGTMAALTALGIVVLENDSRPVETRAGRVWISGIADAWTRTPDVPKTLRDVTDDAPVIAFTHNPDVFPELSPRFSLALAGHTHGGQVRLPFLGTPIVPSKYGSRYVAGHVVEDGRHLFVTTGVGTSILPVRFAVTPEAVVLTLRSAPP